jgi:hypothetical protein
MRVKVACMGPTWSKYDGMLNTQGATVDDFRAATRAVCTAHGYAYLDGKAAVPNNLGYFLDGIHPNDRGHHDMGTFFVQQLRSLGWIQ